MPKIPKSGNEVRSEGAGFPSAVSTNVLPPNPPVPVQPCVSPPVNVVVTVLAARAATPVMPSATTTAANARNSRFVGYIELLAFRKQNSPTDRRDSPSLTHASYRSPSRTRRNFEPFLQGNKSRGRG